VLAEAGRRVMRIEVFGRDLGFIEGPVYGGDGRVLLVSINRGCVYALDPGGQITATFMTGGGPNGLALSREGLYVAQNGGIFGASGTATPGVQCIIGSEVSYLTTELCEAPNDLCFGPDGLLYVSDPATDRALTEAIEGRVLVCDPRSGRTEVVIQHRYFPNGLAFDASGRFFYLAQTYPRTVERFSWTAGRLESDGTFCHLANGRPDGLALDTQGNLWVCTPGTGGIEVFSQDGTPVTRIELGRGTMTTNCCFGGSQGQDLFVTAAGTGELLRLRTDATGLALFPYRGSSDGPVNADERMPP
jgi:gluconolactonase